MKTVSRFPLILLMLILSIFSYSQSFDSLFSKASDSLKNGNLGSQTESIVNQAIIIAEENSDQQWKAILQKGNFYNKKFEYRKTIATLGPIIESIKNDTIKAKYLELVGSSYSYLSISDSAIYYLKLATALCGENKIGSSAINLHVSLGSAYFRAFKEDLAFKEYKTAISLMSNYNDSSSFLPVMGNAAACLMQLGDFENAIKYYKKLELHFGHDEKFIGLIYTNLGTAYYKPGNIDSAEYYYLKSIPLLKTNGNLRFLGATYFNLIPIYLNNSNYDTALYYAQLAEPLFIETQPSRLGYLYTGFGNIYSHLNQNQKALEYYSNALNIAQNQKEWNEAWSVTKKMSDLYEKNGEYKKAFFLLKKKNNYNDSILQEDKLEAIRKYRIEFESEQNENQIAQLKNLNSAKNETIIAKERIQNISTMVFIGFIIIVLIGSYFYYRYRLLKIRLQNKIKLNNLDNKLVLNRLSPHFIFNILNSIQYYINSDNRKKANHYLTIFADLLRKFLNSFSLEYHILEDELTLIGEYVELERMLSNDKFKFTLSIDENVNQQMNIPTMVLQPLIENAIKHGTNLSNPEIRLVLHTQNEMLICVIEDNGKGIDDANDNTDSRGIELCKQHIKLLNSDLKKKISLFWENKTESKSGLKVTIQIPLNYKNEN